MSAVLRPWIAAVKEARSQVAREMKGVDQAIAGGYRGAPAYARAGFKGAEDAAKASDKAIVASAEQSARAQERAAEHVLQIRRRHFQQIQSEEEAAERKRARMLSSVAASAGRNFGGAVRAGAGVLGSIARGAGVNFDIGSAVGKGVQAETRATDLSNSGFQAGAPGANGVQQDPAALLAQVRAVGNATATDTNEALQGLQDFVSKTGDLETGRAVLGDLAKLAKATGTSLADMAGASADVSIALGETPNKAQRLQEIMRSIAGQGKLGAVEIKDLAVQMAKITSSAGRFAGDKGDIIAMLGAMTQEAKARGGATSASQAATSVSSFVGDLTTKAGQKNMTGAGINVFADKGHTTLRSPEEIIIDALKKSKGDLGALSKIFTNKQSGRAVAGFANLYNEAGGGAKGESAVRGEFGKLKMSAMGGGEVQDSFDAAMKTTAAKAQVFQNNLETIATKMVADVLPAMEKLAPVALQVANGFAKLVGWASQNPFEAASVALAGSIVKAGIGEVIKSSLASGMAGAGGPIAAAIAAAIISYELGKMLIDDIAKSHNDGVTDSVNGEASELNAVSLAHAALRAGGTTSNGASDMESEAALLEARIEAVRKETASPLEKREQQRTHTDLTAQQTAAAQNDAPHFTEMINHLGEVKAVLAMIKSGTLNVRVTNPPVPGVDPSGRSGPVPLR